MHTIARLIARCRVERGYSQREMARRMGLSQGAISGLEAGVMTPSIHTLKRLATLMSLTAEQVGNLVLGARAISYPGPRKPAGPVRDTKSRAMLTVDPRVSDEVLETLPDLELKLGASL